MVHLLSPDVRIPVQKPSSSQCFFFFFLRIHFFILVGIQSYIGYNLQIISLPPISAHFLPFFPLLTQYSTWQMSSLIKSLQLVSITPGLLWLASLQSSDLLFYCFSVHCKHKLSSNTSALPRGYKVHSCLPGHCIHCLLSLDFFLPCLLVKLLLFFNHNSVSPSLGFSLIFLPQRPLI